MLPVEVEWHYRIEMADEAQLKDDASYPDLIAVDAPAEIYTLLQVVEVRRYRRAPCGRFRSTEGSPMLTHQPAHSHKPDAAGCRATISAPMRRRAAALGADGSLTPESLVRFSLLSALSTQNDPTRTGIEAFSKNRDGFVLAEGAAALVLETSMTARPRGAASSPHPLSCGEQSEFLHRTPSSPMKAIIAAIRKTIADSGLGPDEIDYINAHGTSTPGVRQDGGDGAPRVRGASPQHPDLLQQIDDRALLTAAGASRR